ncbi:uncharacterized protein N7483_007895 [Penicillium malachiteum]|uniref:uncharacterized protein n=1 Tax=Penicillium malachiteum TaxID=1324776 RepID=UPI00254695C2|nr:uncharacterized protein N7483_007895 [Penicillium malachiteum]KAJ5726538.1 hypothetical protein N7483_007895 [Penicillium malachiteum]
MPSRSPANSLATLAMEERALRARKQNIAGFGCSWIRPAGCAKTMLGMKEEEAEREEALQAAAAEMNVEGMMDDDLGMTQGEEDEGMERDLDDDIPDADVDAEGLIEEGEEGLEEDELDEETYLERDLDDDIPRENLDDVDFTSVYNSDGFDHWDSDIPERSSDEGMYRDLDAEIPEADEGMSRDLDAEIPEADEGMSRDLDAEIPDAVEDGSEQEGEWQHTDTEEEDDYEDEENDQEEGVVRSRFAENFRTSTPNSRSGMLPTPIMHRARETAAQSRFINRWSGGGDAIDSSSLLYEDDDLRASITSQGSQRVYGRRYPRHVGGPRDSLS